MSIFPNTLRASFLQSIKNRVLFVAIAVIVIGGSAAFGLNYALRPVSAAADSGRSHSGQRDLAAALNPDGSLRLGTGGSFDTSGYRMELTATGEPRFVQAPPACSGWDTQFSLPNGVNGTVRALVVSGTDRSEERRVGKEC